MVRKRLAHGHTADLVPTKRPRREHTRTTDGVGKTITHPILTHYYPCVLTLREYVLSRLPSTSRLRRKKIRGIGRGPGPLSEKETQVSHLLDTTFIGSPAIVKGQPDDLKKEWVAYSQQNDESNVTLSDALGNPVFSQTEVRPQLCSQS